jgi:hypothetical protein
MQLHFIIVIESDGNAALSVLGRRLTQTIFGDDQNTAGRSEFDRGAKARDACANHNEFGVNVRARGVDTDNGIASDRRRPERASVCPTG